MAHRRPISLIRSFSVLFVLAGACFDTFGTSVYLRTLSGTPSITADGKVLALKPGDLLPENAVVRTGSQDSVVVYFDEATRVVSLERDSRMRVELQSCSVVLDRGEVVVSVRKGSEAGKFAPLKIRTQAGTTTITRGDFVANAADQVISALSGEATFENASKASLKTSLRAGQALTLDRSNGAAVTSIPSRMNDKLIAQVDKVVTSSPKNIMAPLAGPKLPPPTTP